MYDQDPMAAMAPPMPAGPPGMGGDPQSALLMALMQLLGGGQQMPAGPGAAPEGGLAAMLSGMAGGGQNPMEERAEGGMDPAMMMALMQGQGT